MSDWTIAIIAALALLYVAWTYNRLVVLRNRVANAWSQIDVQLRRRHDLIPNLVEAVKAYMAHERGVIEAVVEARRAAIAAGSDIAARASAENGLGRSLHSLIALAEAMPQLRASENMRDLQEELSSTENRVAFARQHYNDSVTQYNTAIASLPASLLAGLLGFGAKTLFLAAEAERQAPGMRF